MARLRRKSTEHRKSARISIAPTRGDRSARQHGTASRTIVTAATADAEDAIKRRSIVFINWAHALDHYVILIYPTVVIGLGVIYQMSYAKLIALGTPSFIAFGVFSLPAGWLADRWS